MTSTRPDSTPILVVENLRKTYGSGFEALKGVDLTIERGEILALLGPNGAGKTTLISIVCGLVNATSGSVSVDGYDIATDFRKARQLIGLVPQELAVPPFESVWDVVAFSRGLFGKPRNDAYLEQLLRDLALWEKRRNKVMELSGGMKRRVLIAKALAYEPRVLFLDEPTAGVDVELRKDMWQMVHRLRESGVTIILTTHYIEEAEEMADRIGVINRGELIRVQDKTALMQQLGRKQLSLQLKAPLTELPPDLPHESLELTQDGNVLVYSFSTQSEDSDIPRLLQRLATAGIEYSDLHTEETSLEDIFVDLVKESA